MKASLFTNGLTVGALACAMLAGCDRGYTSATAGIEQTKFPGQVTAGGLTSGQIMARSAKPETNAAYSGGTPGIAGGSGGNTAGAALGGTVAETGQGPSQGATPPSGAAQGGNKPTGDYGGPAANAPAAGITPVGSGTATNAPRTPPAVNPTATTGLPAAGTAGAPAAPAATGTPGATGAPAATGTAGAAGQATKPAAPGTLTGDKR